MTALDGFLIAFALLLLAERIVAAFLARNDRDTWEKRVASERDYIKDEFLAPQRELMKEHIDGITRTMEKLQSEGRIMFSDIRADYRGMIEKYAKGWNKNAAMVHLLFAHMEGQSFEAITQAQAVMREQDIREDATGRMDVVTARPPLRDIEPTDNAPAGASVVMGGAEHPEYVSPKPATIGDVAEGL